MLLYTFDPFQSLSLIQVPKKLGYVIVTFTYTVVQKYYFELNTLLITFTTITHYTNRSFIYFTEADHQVAVMLRDTHLLPTDNYAENHGKFSYTNSFV